MAHKLDSTHAALRLMLTNDDLAGAGVAGDRQSQVVAESPASPPLLTMEHALFLDFDGTLVELADHPDHIVVPDFLQDLLISLDRWLDGALAIVTGRRLESLDSFLSPLKLRAAGVHGAQLRHQPAIEPPEMFTLGDLALRLAARFHGDPQVWIEDKREAVAVHYRQAPEREQEISASLAQFVTADDLEIIAGNCVFEVRRSGTGKDAAVRWLMAGRPFRDRIPVFVGDDRTDEDGIREVQRQGGFGIKVGAAASEAEWRLATPAAVHEWLGRMLP